MAHVSGPCSSLPGSHHSVPANATCDTHQDRPAVKRVQGETDSFGAEYFDCCQECYDKYKAEVAANEVEAATGMCEWCKQHATDLRKRRDFEEGSCGRLYDVCGACVRRENESLEEERSQMDDDFFYGDDD